jgi:hypothetical protein
LNIVVESQIFVAVLFKEAEGVVVAEIFKLDQSILAVTVYNGCHELVNQLVISISGDSLLSQSDVERIIQQFLNFKQTV